MEKRYNMFKSRIKKQAHDESKPRQSVIDTLSDPSGAKIGLGLAARTASPTRWLAPLFLSPPLFSSLVSSRGEELQH